jgi:hypothetical protein
MHMISHQYIGMDVAPVPFTGLSQPIKEEQIIIGGSEGNISVVSTLDQMLWLARHHESRKSGHIFFSWKDCFRRILLSFSLSIESDPFGFFGFSIESDPFGFSYTCPMIGGHFRVLQVELHAEIALGGGRTIEGDQYIDVAVAGCRIAGGRADKRQLRDAKTGLQLRLAAG